MQLFARECVIRTKVASDCDVGDAVNYFDLVGRDTDGSQEDWLSRIRHIHEKQPATIRRNGSNLKIGVDRHVGGCSR